MFISDEGFLRMSRGGEAFGRRPPPPPLILGPPHFSTQTPSRVFPTNSPNTGRERGKSPIPSVPPRSNNNDQLLLGVGDNSRPNLNTSRPRNNNGEQEETKPALPKDVNAVFSKVSSGGGGGSSGGEGDSDAHPLLGITPAAPGEAFDFNPILSNPAVTRILAGSSGRIPQWEPSQWEPQLPDLHGNSLMNICPSFSLPFISCDYMGAWDLKANQWMNETSVLHETVQLA